MSPDPDVQSSLQAMTVEDRLRELGKVLIGAHSQIRRAMDRFVSETAEPMPDSDPDGESDHRAEAMLDGK